MLIGAIATTLGSCFITRRCMPCSAKDTAIQTEVPHTHTHMHACTHTYTHAHTHINTCMYAHNTHTQIHAYTQTYTHTTHIRVSYRGEGELEFPPPQEILKLSMVIIVVLSTLAI